MADETLIEHSTAMAKATGLAHAELVKLRASGLNARQMAGLSALEAHLNAISDANVQMGDVARQAQEAERQEQQAAAAEKRAKALPV